MDGRLVAMAGERMKHPAIPNSVGFAPIPI
jgi:hypothetical protein